LVGTGKVVELILARTADDNRMYLTQCLRRDLGKATIVFRSGGPTARGEVPKPVQPYAAGELAQTIRAAVARGVSGLIVEPIEDPAVLDALYDAENQGVRVLLLDQPVAPRGGKSIPCIQYVSFTEAGRQIVQAVLDAAKLMFREDAGRIILMHNRSLDPYAAPQFESLTGALKALGKSFEVIAFDRESTSATDALRKSLAANPKVAIVLADDEQGMGAAYTIRKEWTESNHPEFLFGGYLAYDFRSVGDLLGRAAAFADRSIESFAVKTSQTMRSLLEGKPVSDRVEIPIVVRKKQTLFVPTVR
jgi:ABC-type sugar transport system substrate-binding protein